MSFIKIDGDSMVFKAKRSLLQNPNNALFVKIVGMAFIGATSKTWWKLES
jgi:hypothetical protein